MKKAEVLGRLNKDFPQIKIERIRKIGEGLGNIAFEINRTLIFRFPKAQRNQEELKKEIPILKVAAKYSTLPVPDFTYIAPDNSYVGYKKLEGRPLIKEVNKFNNWQGFSEKLGVFLTAINNIPLRELGGLDINRGDEALSGYLKDAYDDFQKAKSYIPEEQHLAIEEFFKEPPPRSSWDPVFCHNDLGIEHILVDKSDVSGVIDWGDTAITDPAYDLGLICRDLGEEITKSILGFYDPPEGNNKAEIFERAIFYGKCSLFEDISFGVTYRRSEYVEKSLATIKRMFA